MDGELPFSMMDVIVLLNLPYPPSGRASYNINCPCCDTHNKRHMNINFTKGVFRCPRCGFAGGVLDLYSHYANMDRAQAYKVFATLVMPSLACVLIYVASISGSESVLSAISSIVS